LETEASGSSAGGLIAVNYAALVVTYATYVARKREPTY
jgi:hypothetical protein